MIDCARPVFSVGSARVRQQAMGGIRLTPTSADLNAAPATIILALPI